MLAHLSVRVLVLGAELPSTYTDVLGHVNAVLEFPLISCDTPLFPSVVFDYSDLVVKGTKDVGTTFCRD